MFKKIGDWVKSNLQWLLIIPVVIQFLFWIFKVIMSMIKKPDDNDRVQNERDYRNTVEAIGKDEQEKLDKVDRNSDNTKQGIDKGDPKPADIFNETISGKK